MNAPMSLAAVKVSGGAIAQVADQKIDMFSLRGFELAQRIAKAFASSDAVPSQFRSAVLKKSRDGDQWIENPAAMGNCLVAIETARAVGVSITAVMQQANIIEGKLSWSAQFVIAAVNASGRFQPLRFDIKSRGMIKAKYKEKLGWNKAKGGFDFEDKTVELEDLVCIAWTLPNLYIAPKGIYTLAQARAADLPIIESSPVSMKMAVEEGWYSKAGSKWQTEMKHQMLQYRSGAFFGRIHAPDIVMGMGRTSEELVDVAAAYDVAADGTVSAVPVSELRAAPAGATRMAEVVESTQQPTEESVDATTGEINGAPTFDPDAFAEKMARVTSIDILDLMADEIRDLTTDDDMAESLTDVYKRRRAELVAAPPAPAAGRRTRSTAPAVE